MARRFKVVGISFDHMHMGDNLAMAHAHPEVEIAGLWDERRERMQPAVERFGIPTDRIFDDLDECLEQTRPDLAILCPATARHAELTLRVARHGVNVLIEKPFAESLQGADAMIEALRDSGKLLAINWPLAWYPSHVTAHRLVAEGAIGEIREVHYYDGNRGPLWHVAHKEKTTPEFVEREKPRSWFYKREAGGGSLLDYLGYGTTLGSWFLDGRVPRDVTCVVDEPAGLEVDEHSVTVVRYDCGISKFETRWGTFSDPWTHQPQPKCGFVLCGSEGTLSSYDFEPSVRLQNAVHPEGHEVAVDELRPPHQNPVQYVLHCLAEGLPVQGPLSPELSRRGQQIVDAAVQSAAEGRTVPLPGAVETDEGDGFLTDEQEYGLGRLSSQKESRVPDLPYLPQNPKRYQPGIGLIGCGGITEHHLKAYRSAGYRVVALCDTLRDRAEEKARLFYPDAAVTDDYRELLQRDDVEVVDAATHPEERVEILEASIEAGKHVLSQKPFAIDLDVGQRLVDLADSGGVQLAVNQNGRWAPHFSWIRCAIDRDLLGPVTGLEFSGHFDHNWVVDTPFNDVEHLLLYDYAIHWFDACLAFLQGRRVTRIYAAISKSATQAAKQPLVGCALGEFDGGQVTWHFHGDRPHGQSDRTTVAGAKGSIHCYGPNFQQQKLFLYCAEGVSSPVLEGAWFPDGFHGAMGELLCAIEDGRRPVHNARDNLASLALCFAAVESSMTGQPQVPGEVRRLPRSPAPGAPDPATSP